MINVGIIGCGKIAVTRHLPEYQENPDANIVAVYDENLERTLKTAEKYHAKPCKSIEELLSLPEIHAISVCTANAFHYPITIQALKAGKHVLCEKPMAVTLAECEDMVNVARQMHRYLMVGHNQRLARTHVKAREMILNGSIGKLLTFQTNFLHSGPETWTIDRNNNWFFDKTSAAFGAMADLGVHKTDLIQFLTGEKIVEVMAYASTLDKKNSSGEYINVDDNAFCIYKMESGIAGTMVVSWTDYGAENNSTTLYGTDGVIHLYEHPDYSIIVEKKDGTSEYYKIDQIQTNSSQTKSGIIDMWIDCLVQDKQPTISGEEALSSMKAVFAALESVDTGRRVKIK